MSRLARCVSVIFNVCNIIIAKTRQFGKIFAIYTNVLCYVPGYACNEAHQ